MLKAQGFDWTLREWALLPGGPRAKLWEGRFVFRDGAGVRVWPASAALAGYLRDTGLASDCRLDADRAAAAASWCGKRVLELGCGCGALALVLSGWDCELVVATDASEKALELARANARQHVLNVHRFPVFRDLDWNDLTECAALRRELGPFDAVVVADGVLAVPPAAPMWKQNQALARRAASPPGPLLDATRVLAPGAEVVLAVTDRKDDVQETARALLDRRQYLELLSTPLEVVADVGDRPVTIFHFRWKAAAGGGAAVTQKLWDTI